MDFSGSGQRYGAMVSQEAGLLFAVGVEVVVNEEVKDDMRAAQHAASRKDGSH
jgi:hypothetical protein